MLEPTGVRLAVVPQRGQILHLRQPGIDTAGWPVLMPLNSYYLLAFEDSRVVVGATRETGTGFDYRVTAAGVAEVQRGARGGAGAFVLDARGDTDRLSADRAR